MGQIGFDANFRCLFYPVLAELFALLLRIEFMAANYPDYEWKEQIASVG